jgi:GntR family transcriptional regulator, transcriptional repressor for pyruvate dehydrogenase complex
MFEMALNDVVLNRTKVTDQITNILKQSILSGEFKPGDKFPREDEIAVKFRVSKVSVREALRNLEMEGLVEKRRGIFGGNFIAQPGMHKMDELVSNFYQFGSVTPAELIEFRRMLEPALLGVVVTHRTDEDLGKMRANMQEIEEGVVSGKINPAKILEFHHIVAEACHNQLCAAVVKALTNVCGGIADVTLLTLDDGKQHLGFSKRLYDYILRRDKEGAQKAIMAHFEAFEKHINRSVKNRKRNLKKSAKH